MGYGVTGLNQRLYKKMDAMTAPQKWSQSLLHVIGGDMDQTKKSKYMIKKKKIVSIIWGSSYHTEVCLTVLFFYKKQGEPSLLTARTDLWLVVCVFQQGLVTAAPSFDHCITDSDSKRTRWRQIWDVWASSLYRNFRWSVVWTRWGRWHLRLTFDFLYLA